MFMLTLSCSLFMKLGCKSISRLSQSQSATRHRPLTAQRHGLQHSPLHRHQIMLLSDRSTRVLATCPRLLCSSARPLVQQRTNEISHTRSVKVKTRKQAGNLMGCACPSYVFTANTRRIFLGYFMLKTSPIHKQHRADSLQKLSLF